MKFSTLIPKLDHTIKTGAHYKYLQLKHLCVFRDLFGKNSGKIYLHISS